MIKNDSRRLLLGTGLLRQRRESSGRPLVQILSFDGRPNHESARALVERVSAELEPEPRLLNVPR